MPRQNAIDLKIRRKAPAHRPLPWPYRQLARASALSYFQKIALCVLLSAHVPVAICLLAWAGGLFSTHPPAPGDLVAALVGTVASAAATLWLVRQMLRPVALSALALETYALHGEVTALPARYEDMAGRLMRNTSGLLGELEGLRRGPDNVDPATELPNRAFLTRLIEEFAGAGLAFRVRMLRIIPDGRPVRREAATALLRALSESLERDDAARTIARIDDHTLAVVELVHGDGKAAVSMLGIARDLMRDAHGEVAALHAGDAVFPRDGADAEGLLAAAVAALAPLVSDVSQAPLPRPAAHAAPDLDRDLRRAVENGDFRLYLQPVVATSTERIVSAEALLRWNRPLSGDVPPSRFIPLLEEAGMIDEVGRWVLTAACRAIKICDASGLTDLQIAVNVSARECRNPRLLRQISEVLAFEGVAPHRIELELTESAATEDLTRSRALFTGLRDLGVGVAIDDFGTGQGGLGYLKALPFSKLKIDREFVAGVDIRRDCQAICRSAITLAGGFDIDVVAEGVETAAEAARLRTFGCTQLQGYRFGRPMPAMEFPAFARLAS